MPATSMFMSHGFPIKSMGGCGSGTVGRYMAEWWNSAAASEQGSSGLGRGPLSLAEQGSSFFDLGSLDFIYNNIIFLRSTGLILCGPFDFGPLAKLPVCEALGLSHILYYIYIYHIRSFLVISTACSSSTRSQVQVMSPTSALRAKRGQRRHHSSVLVRYKLVYKPINLW